MSEKEEQSTEPVTRSDNTAPDSNAPSPGSTGGGDAPTAERPVRGG
ncbi:MAG: hypothetical protein H0W42_10680, partial [Gemmatimonadaceae bacterium]|nr:hypothetical protein [Gemmatimonadaceae bacterium]